MAKNTSDSEARAIRRRWITLGETVAVLALLISALTLWNSYAERRHAEDKEAAAAESSGVATHTLRLKGTRGAKDRRLDLAPLRDGQVIESQTIRFPTALGLSPVDTAGDPRIEAAWFEDALKKARKAAGRNDETAGDERLPVEIVTRFLADGEPAADNSIYEVGYQVHGGLFGSSVSLRGLSLESPAGKRGQAKLDALWKARMGAH